MYDSANELIQGIAGRGKKETFRIATVTGLFSGGGAKLRFDGETQPSGKKYARLAPYTPTAGDRVLTARVNSTDVILGKIQY